MFSTSNLCPESRITGLIPDCERAGVGLGADIYYKYRTKSLVVAAVTFIFYPTRNFDFISTEIYSPVV